MLHCLLATILLQTAEGPVIPAGMNQHFVTSCYAVEGKLSAGDFDGAAQAVGGLPTQNIVVKWNDEPVPKQLRAGFEHAKNAAMAEWQVVPGLKISNGEDADLLFTFVGRLPATQAGGLPAGATFEFSQTKPFLHATIALNRSTPPDLIRDADVHNEVMFALAQYLGLERTPRFLGATSRTDESTTSQVRLLPFESNQARAALEIAGKLRALVASHSKIEVKKPVLSLSKGAIDGLRGAEAAPLGFVIDVQNKGTSDLRLAVLPDCSCLAPAAPPSIAPGESGQIEVAVNTELYTGYLLHRLYVYSNDPAWPVDEIPVKMYVEPLYRFVREGPEVVPLTDHGADIDLYMILSSRATFVPLTARIYGPKGSVAFHAWHGKLPFDSEDPDAEKKGYKYHLHIEPTREPGSLSASVMIGTDNALYRELRSYTFDLQKGIVALPGQLYVGTLTSLPARFDFLVSRPFSGFKVRGVSTDSPFLTASYISTRGDREYRVDLAYNGKAEFGDFGTTVKVFTDDPQQPVIPVSVRGTVQ